MRNLHNIERSGFHRGEYVGYSCGEVWNIVKKPGGGWHAVIRNKVDGVFTWCEGATLTRVSEKLDTYHSTWSKDREARILAIIAKQAA